MSGAYVCILRCADGRYYVGTTRANLEARVAQHNAGTFNGFTKGRRPVELVYFDHFERITDAISAERQLKGWSRAKKEALIRGDYDALHTLAMRRRKMTPPSSFDTRAPRAAQDEGDLPRRNS